MFLFTLLAFIALIAGSITDLKTREVPDWVNYGLFFAALTLRIILSTTLHDWHLVVDGAFGFAAMVLVGSLIFYTGQMGGGDAKLMMAMGMLIGLPWRAGGIISSPLLAFLLNSIIAGGVYGLIWTLSLTIRHWHHIRKAFTAVFAHPAIRRVRFWGIVASAVLLLITFLSAPLPFKILALFLVLIYLTILYSYVLIKAVEQTCMYKQLPIGKLTVGDWIPKNIIVDGKRIVGPKDLGISAAQITLLQKLAKQKKIKTVLVKEGIPFVPSFLIAYATTLLWGNVLFLLFAM